jgi:hypothetical protein
VCPFAGLVPIGIEPAAGYDSGVPSAANLQVGDMDTGVVSLDRGREDWIGSYFSTFARCHLEQFGPRKENLTEEANGTDGNGI